MELRVCARCKRIHAGVTTCPSCRGAITLADADVLVGEVFGKYRLEAVLGAGGMGVVYRARHTTLDRPAALKIVLPESGDEHFHKRFLREAKLLAELKHPSVVEIYDFDVSQWAVPYYVMECLEGASLRHLLISHAKPFWLDVLSPILTDTAAGLELAHKKGIVHRDLKPENLYAAVFEDRVVTKILDFGIAKLAPGIATPRTSPRPGRSSARSTTSPPNSSSPAPSAPTRISTRSPW
ncbi:MAG: serine/threonine-protein kinase [Acidobacteriota bacterium]